MTTCSTVNGNARVGSSGDEERVASNTGLGEAEGVTLRSEIGGGDGGAEIGAGDDGD